MVPGYHQPQSQKNLTPRSLIIFLFVGGFATGLHYALSLLFIYGLGCGVVLASAAGYGLSAIANYLLNARLTFKSKASHQTTAPRFVTVAAAGLLMNYFLLSALIAFGLHFVPAQLLTTFCVILWNYVINGLWTFSSTKD